MNTRVSHYLFTFLLAIIFLLPIPLGANRPWAWSFFQICIFLLTIGCTFHYRSIPWLGTKPYSKIYLFWFPLIILAFIQIIPLPFGLINVLSPYAAEIQQNALNSTFYFSLDRGQSIISFFKLVSYFCLFCCVLMLINNEKRIRILLLTIVASGTFQAVYGAFEILLGANSSLVFNLNVTNSATGTFVYKNHYANILMMCASAGIGLLVMSLQQDRHTSSKDMLRSTVRTLLSSKALIRIAVAIMVIGLVMSRSRMGNTAFFLAMTLVGFASLYLIKNRSKGLTVLVISMFIIDLFIVSAYFGLEKVQQRLASTSLQQETRDEVVKDAIPIIFDYPLLGTGGGSFYSVFPHYQKAEVHLFYDHAHNDYIQMTVEYGLPVLFVQSVMMMYLFYKAVRPMRRRKPSVYKGASFACTMVVVGMLTHMTVDFPLQAYSNACYFIVFLALAMVLNHLNAHSRSSN